MTATIQQRINPHRPWYDTPDDSDYTDLDDLPDRSCLASHLDQVSDTIGQARAMLGSDGHYTTPAERIMADTLLEEALARCTLLVCGLRIA